MLCNKACAAVWRSASVAHDVADRKTHLMASFMEVPVVSSWTASASAVRSLSNADCAASPSSPASGFADTLRLCLLPAACSSL